MFEYWSDLVVIWFSIYLRYQDQLEQQKQANDENLRRTEESVAKQEQIKQQTFQKELQMREQERKNRIKEEAEVKAKVRRRFVYFSKGYLHLVSMHNS